MQADRWPSKGERVPLNRSAKQQVRSSTAGKDASGLVDAKVIARATHLPLSSIWRACREGRLPFYRLGRTIRLDLLEVKEVLRRNGGELPQEDDNQTGQYGHAYGIDDPAPYTAPEFAKWWKQL